MLMLVSKIKPLIIYESFVIVTNGNIDDDSDDFGIRNYF